MYGNGWDKHGLDARHLRGGYIPNEDLRRFYSSASIVLNDTWEDMRAAGFISNRIYDALACGAFVLSDDVAGLADEFDGGVAVYRDEAGLARGCRASTWTSPHVAARPRSAVGWR